MLYCENKSNITPTIREYVYLVRCGHFLSRDKDGGHNTGSAISKNPMQNPNSMISFIQQDRLIAQQCCANMEFRLFLLL